MRTRPVDFLIVGGARCGTAYLYDRCNNHPEIKMCRCKEPHFFDYRYHLGMYWYMKQFPARKVTGEATADYMFYPPAAYRIRAALPDIKLIVLLRNPVDRAYSHWALRQAQGSDEKSFKTAIRAEGGRTKGRFRAMSYLARGLYVDQIARLFRLFPRQQILILKSEDLFATPDRQLSRVYDFVGVGSFHCSAKQLAVNRHKGCYVAPMRVSIRSRLTTFFREPNRLLYELIGRDMKWDK